MEKLKYGLCIFLLTLIPFAYTASKSNIESIKSDAKKIGFADGVRHQKSKMMVAKVNRLALEYFDKSDKIFSNASSISRSAFEKPIFIYFIGKEKEFNIINCAFGLKEDENFSAINF